MNAEDFRTQVRELLARHRSADSPRAGATQGVCVPLRLAGAGDLAVVAELIRRVAASHALAAAHAAGLLRFELTIDPAVAPAAAAGGGATPAAGACCDGCARGEACRCEPSPTGGGAATTVTPLLRGVVTERDIKALPSDCRLVGAAPRAVITPLARDALRQRGIAVQPAKES